MFEAWRHGLVRLPKKCFESLICKLSLFERIASLRMTSPYKLQILVKSRMKGKFILIQRKAGEALTHCYYIMWNIKRDMVPLLRKPDRIERHRYMYLYGAMRELSTKCFNMLTDQPVEISPRGFYILLNSNLSVG